MEDYTAHEKLRVTSGRSDNVLVHYGTDGMKWGRRKYQYEDGSLTPLGRIHYGVGEAKEKSKIKIREAQAKAKAAAKVEKAKAKAEVEKIKAQAKAYRAKKDADEETERQRIKAEKEAEEARAKAELKAEKAREREETRRVEAEVNADERMQKAGIEAAANQTKSENSKLTALKVVAGVAAAAGIGYLLYKKLGKSGDTNSASKVIEKSEETGKKFVDNVKNKPAAEIIEKGNKAAEKASKKSTDMTDAINKLSNAAKQEASSERVRRAKEKVARDELNKTKERLFTKIESENLKGQIAKSKAMADHYTKRTAEITSGQNAVLNRILKSKAKVAFDQARAQGMSDEAWRRRLNTYTRDIVRFGKIIHSEDSTKDMVLIHSSSNEIYHWGIPGMRWGVRRYQNPDGTLTELGKQHYGAGGKAHSKLDKAIDKVEKKIDKSTKVQRNAVAYLSRPYQDADMHNYMVNAFNSNRTKAWKNYQLEKDLLAVRGERPVSKENDPDNPYSDDRTVLKKGTLLNSVSENFLSSDNYLKNKRAMYLYKDKEEWDNKVYKGPFAEYLIDRNGYVGTNSKPVTQFIKEHKFKTVKDLTMPTQQQKIDAFKEMLNDRRLKKDLQDVQKKILAIDNFNPDRKEMVAKLDVNNIKTSDDLKAAYEVFNHCMENTGRYKSATKYLKKMSKSYDAMTDDNNRGVYNGTIDPIIVFKASKVLEKHGDTNLKDFLSMDEIVNNTEEIRKKNGKVSF